MLFNTAHEGCVASAQAVAPLFRCLARAIDRDGGRGVEIASRLGYDDVNECFCRRDVVHQVPTRAAVAALGYE